MRESKFILVATLIMIMNLYSCKKESSFLYNAIKNDAIICPLIYTKDSATIMISISSKSMLDEMCHDINVKNSITSLYKSIKNENSICVSNKFYEKHSYMQIHVDSIMDSIYQKQGVKGLLKKYFKRDMEMYILWNSEQIYFLKGASPYPAFGQDHNIGYMAYLLSKHDIFLRYLWLDEDTISLIILSETLSDMKQFGS